MSARMKSNQKGKQTKKVDMTKSASRLKHSRNNEAERTSTILKTNKLKEERKFKDDPIQSKEEQAKKRNNMNSSVRMENTQKENMNSKQITKKDSPKTDNKRKRNVVESGGNNYLDENSNKKRKRSRGKKKTTYVQNNNDCSNHEIVTQGKNKDMKGLLNGLVLAVSTLDVKGKQHESNDSSYKAVLSLCKSLGASISGQVHQRVYAVICNRSAVSQRTQRIRKAQQKGILLLDVEWVRQCKSQRKRIQVEPYRLDFLFVDDAEKNQPKNKKKQMDNDVQFLTDEEEYCINAESTGWTAPVELDCCCVCHENGDENCKWCVSCNVTLTKIAKEKISN